MWRESPPALGRGQNDGGGCGSMGLPGGGGRGGLLLGRGRELLWRFFCAGEVPQANCIALKCKTYELGVESATHVESLSFVTG